MRTSLVVVVLGAVACGGVHHDAPPGAHPIRGSELRSDELLHEAAAAHAKRFPLDDRAPFEVLPVDEPKDVELYLEACRAGDHPACWIAAELAQQDAHARTPTNQEPELTAAARDALTLVEQNCRAGDHDSCVALPPDDEHSGRRFPDAPGAAGRSYACQMLDPDNLQACPTDQVRAECEAGFAESCRAASSLIGFATPRPPDASTRMAELDKRTAELGMAGCRARIVRQCGWAPADAPENVRYSEAATVCDLGQRCSGLAALLLARGETLAARDAAERGCQFFRDRCAELGVMYLDGKLPETVPGRGQRIVDFVCDSVRRHSGEKMMQGYAPCARAKLGP